jgi:hypothetical protein
MQREAKTTEKIVKIIPHPLRAGYWTISVDGWTSGCFDSYAVAVGHAYSA